jgi:hypothetical protein
MAGVHGGHVSEEIFWVLCLERDEDGFGQELCASTTFMNPDNFMCKLEKVNSQVEPQIIRLGHETFRQEEWAACCLKCSQFNFLNALLPEHSQPLSLLSWYFYSWLDAYEDPSSTSPYIKGLNFSPD